MREEQGGKFSPWSINFLENVAVVLRLERISHLHAKVPPLYNNAVFSVHSTSQRAVDKFCQPREGRAFFRSSTGHSWTQWFPSLGQWYLNNVRIVKWIDLSLPFNDPRQMRCLASIIRPSNVTSKSRRSVIFSRCSFVRDFRRLELFSVRGSYGRRIFFYSRLRNNFEVQRVSRFCDSFRATVSFRFLLDVLKNVLVLFGVVHLRVS